METNMVVRKYTLGDKEGLQSLLVELQDFSAQTDLTNGYVEAVHFDGEKYTALTLKEASIIFVAEHEGGLVGCIVGEFITDSEKSKLEMPDPSIKRAYISDLYVTEEFRSHGVGSQLMEAIEMYFTEAGCGELIVGVLANNSAGHTFYKKSGYVDRSIDMVKIIAG